MCRLTKYGFLRRSMPAARFRQWHFNRRARNSCLHLHRVVSPLPSFPLFACLFVVIPTRRGSRLLALRIYMSRIVCRARCGCRCAWNYSRVNTSRRTAGVHACNPTHTCERIGLTNLPTGTFPIHRAPYRS